MLSDREQEAAVYMLGNMSTKVQDSMCIIIGRMDLDGRMFIESAGQIAACAGLSFVVQETLKSKALGAASNYNYREDSEE